MTEPPASGELRRLTSLRWYAALLVYLLHIGGNIDWAPLQAFSFGATGVTFFFVLSGFVLTWSVDPGQRARTFYRRRFARIYPSMIAMLLVTVVLAAAVPSLGIRTGALGLVTCALALQAWFRGPYPVYAYNGSAWSLSVEAFFYALFPAIVGPLRRMRARHTVSVGVVALFLGGLATAALSRAGHGPDIAYSNPLVRLPEFLLGVVLALRLKGGWRPRISMLGSIVVVALAAALARHTSALAVRDYVVLLPFAAVIVAGALADIDRTGGWLTHPVSVYLGRVSFCFYLVHEVLTEWIVKAAGWHHHWSLAAGVLPTTVTLVASVAAAMLLHHVVEVPFERRIKRRPRDYDRTMPHGGTVRLLWLSKETPDRNGHGGQRRQFFQLQQLCQAGVDVTVLTPAGAQSDDSISTMVAVIRFRSRRFGRTPVPDPVELATGGGFDRVVITHAESFELLRDKHDRVRVPWLLDFQNVNSRWYRRLGDEATTAFWIPIEREILAHAHANLTCSVPETEALLVHSPTARVSTAPNGIDPAEWPESALAPRDENTVAMYGSWWYPPNRDAIEWFLSAVWPKIRSSVPAARLLVAGPGEPPEAVRQALGVSVLGRVDDIAGLLGRVQVVALPILDGPGTPVKFAESLASGAAVVATTDAASGNPDAPAVLSNEPDRLAAGIVQLLTNRPEAERLGAAGRHYAFSQCTWEITQRPLVDWTLSGRFDASARAS